MERVTIASIDFDETGALKAIAANEAAFARLEGGSARAARTLQNEWNKSGGVFVQRMFSMRSAAVAMLGGFTVAGGIIGLKNAFESLGMQVFTASGNVDRFNASLDVTRGVINSMLLDLPGVRDLMKDIADLPLLIGAFVQTAKAQPLNILSMMLLGEPLTAGQMKSVMDEFTGALDILRAKRDKLLVPPPKPPGLPVKPFALPETFLRPFGAEGAPEDFEVLGKNLAQFSPFADQAAASTIRLRDAMMGIKQLDVGGEFAQTFLRAGTTVTAFADGPLPTLFQRLNEVGGAFDSLKTAAGEAFGAILAGQNIDLRGFINHVLTAIATESAVKAIFELAEGLAASARFAASYGFDAAAGVAAKLHFAAAKQYGATAVGAGLGARAFGSGGSGGGGGGGGGGFSGGFLPQEQRQPQRQITINVQGVVLGTNRAAVASELMDYIRLAERRND